MNGAGRPRRHVALAGHRPATPMEQQGEPWDGCDPYGTGYASSYRTFEDDFPIDDYGRYEPESAPAHPRRRTARGRAGRGGRRFPHISRPTLPRVRRRKLRRGERGYRGERMPRLGGKARRPLNLVGLLAFAGVLLAVAMAGSHVARLLWPAQPKVEPAPPQEQPATLPAQRPDPKPTEPQEPVVPATPRSEWQQGELPYLYQTDKQWADLPYAESDIEESGCGPTCLSMVYIAETGKTDMGPIEMAAFSTEGNYIEAGMTKWSLMSKGAKELGLNVSELSHNDKKDVVQALKGNRPLIMSVKPGDFTDVGHFLVASGITDDGKLRIHDPNSPQNSAKDWDLDRVLDQCSNIWVFDPLNP